MSDKIIQIIPAPTNLYWYYTNDDGTVSRERVLCLGLTNTEDVVLLDVDENGTISDVTSYPNFRRIAWG